MNKKIMVLVATVAGIAGITGAAFASASNTPAGWPSGKPMFCVNRGTNTVVFNYARNPFCAQGTYPLDSSGYVPNIVVSVVTASPTLAPADVITVTKPVDQTSIVGVPVANVKVNATDSVRREVLTYTMSGAPHGLVIDRRTGVISGTVTSQIKAQESFSVTVTVTDGTGATGTTTFTWTVNEPGV